MAKFVKGDVVIVPFPFSDLTQSKRRPALVVAALDGDDVILCRIPSKTIKDNLALSLDDGDFSSGSLKQPGNIRPNRIFISFYTEPATFSLRSFPRPSTKLLR